MLAENKEHKIYYVTRIDDTVRIASQECLECLVAIIDAFKEVLHSFWTIFDTIEVIYIHSTTEFNFEKFVLPVIYPELRCHS